MYAIDNSTALESEPARGAVGPNPGGFFTNGNPGAGLPATIVDADWANAVQNEILNVIVAAGLTPSKTNDAQLASALTTLIASGANPSGSVVFFATNTPPTGFLECNGSAISRTTYAALFAKVGTLYGPGDGATTFNIPDLRGQFIRGWDHGAGVDSGRAFGSNQTDAMQGHVHTLPSAIIDGSVTGNIGTGTHLYDHATATGSPVTDGANGAPRTAAETRPVNVALLPCIKY